MSQQLRNVPGTLAFLLIICETTAVPPRLQLVRRVHCRGHRFRRPSIGRNFRPDSVQTTLQSETCCTGFHLSNEILGKASSRFVSDYRNSSMSSDGREHLHSGGFCNSVAGVPTGRRLVVLHGQKKAVVIAVENVSGRRRWSKLREWLS